MEADEHRLGAIADFELAKDGGNVVFHRLIRDPEFEGNLMIAHSQRDQFDDVEFAAGKRVDRCRKRAQPFARCDAFAELALAGAERQRFERTQHQIRLGSFRTEHHQTVIDEWMREIVGHDQQAIAVKMLLQKWRLVDVIGNNERQLDDHDIRTALGEVTEELLEILCFTDEFETRLRRKEKTHSKTKQRMCIGDDDTDMLCCHRISSPFPLDSDAPRLTRHTVYDD